MSSPDASDTYFGESLTSFPYEYVEVADNVSPAEGSFAYDDSQVTQVIDLTSPIAYDDVPGAIQAILGSHTTDPSLQQSPSGLVRKPPLRHPLFTTLYATKVLVRWLKPDVTTPKQTDSQSGNYACARYVRPRLTVTFSALPFDPYYRSSSDATAGNEWMRYLVKVPQLCAEQVQLQAGVAVYAEGPGSAITGGSPKPAQSVPDFGATKIIPRADLQWTWMHVPEDYLFDSNGIPTLIQPGIGCVNSQTFAGRAPGTLLAMPPQFTPTVIPAYATGIPPSSLRLFNVTFLFKFYDPELYPGANNGTGTALQTGQVPVSTHGHNTAFFLDNAGAGNALAKFNVAGGLVSKYPYTPYNFANFFRLQSLTPLLP